MTLARAILGFALVSLGSGAAGAQDLDFGNGLLGGYQRTYVGIKDLSDIPAPIPVPAANPVPEGFTYYLRLDGGYGTQAQKPSFSETGRVYGAGGAGLFSGAPTFGYAGSGFSSLRDQANDVGFAGFGFGAYLTPRLRGDVTLEFRTEQASNYYGNYSYVSAGGGNPTISGTLHDSMRTLSVVGLVNGYIDLLPRGGFTPYVGAGVGMVYHQINRSYLARESTPGFSLDIGGSDGTSRAAFAAALMGGATFAFDHRWAIDVNYRALYMQGSSVTLTTTGLNTNQVTTATIGDSWEHQVRVGLRFNIW